MKSHLYSLGLANCILMNGHPFVTVHPCVSTLPDEAADFTRLIVRALQKYNDTNRCPKGVHTHAKR